MKILFISAVVICLLLLSNRHFESYCLANVETGKDPYVSRFYRQDNFSHCVTYGYVRWTIGDWQLLIRLGENI